jgi:GDPmannose 4,6-dehydratase
MKKALITGVTGQDGSYLAELLLEKGYEVHGIIRRSSSFNTGRVDHLYRDPHDKAGKSFFLHYGDLSDGSSLQAVLEAVQPDEVYNLGAQSHVRVSFDIPEYTGDISGLGSVRLLEAIRKLRLSCRYYQASSSEIFGSSPPPQNESTPLHPRSPYGAAKAYAYYLTKNYREAYGIFAVNGILFNHESERRGETFVTRKISRAAGRIAAGLQQELYLGNLDARRDWGHAEDYVRAMWLMLQQPEPDDYVIGTGESHSVRDVLDLAFRFAGLGSWERYVKTDPRYVRPAEVDELCADASKAQSKLGWFPEVGFEELIERMTASDVKLARRERRALETIPPGPMP